MDRYPHLKKYVAVGIILIFIGTCTIPSATSKQINKANIITVDDEPGDADFTSIKEAVNFSSPGDTIEVYSGTYPEDGIRILKDNITLLGIAHELGGGDDSGKPFIKGVGLALVIHVEASHVIVSNFLIENPWAHNLSTHPSISVGNTTIGIGEPERNNITISDCSIRNTPEVGISVGDVGANIRIINNEIFNCTYGISTTTVTHKYWMTITITGNVLNDCFIVGILFDGGHLTSLCLVRPLNRAWLNSWTSTISAIFSPPSFISASSVKELIIPRLDLPRHSSLHHLRD